jgi:2-C-methyl-D-erythritol 4-phosphate cytidylyltransferase
VNRYVIIAAGGSGIRAGADVPKQFVPLAGKPVLMHTIEAFANQDPGIKIIIALPGQHIRYWLDLCEKFAFKPGHSMVVGGSFRGGSVRSALDGITESEALVAVHDGARPFVDSKTIEKGFELALIHGAAIPVLKITDSVRIVDHGFNRPVDRNNFRSVQTPQCFKLSVLLEAYKQENLEDFTDDASLVENMGHKIQLFEGNPENIKITTPLDLLIAEVVVNKWKA